MTSIWHGTERGSLAVPFEGGARFDDVIVGAGITGLSTALMLVRRGRRVVVVEAESIGAVTTGNSTGKLSLLQGTRLSRIRSGHPASLVRAYADANREALEWLLRFAEESGLPWQERDAVSYAETEQGVAAVHAEYAAAREAGLDVRFAEDAGQVFPTRAAVRLAGQAQVDPAELVAYLAAAFVDAGGVLHEGVRVSSVAPFGRPRRVRTDQGDLLGDAVVLATGVPILDRGLSFIKVRALRSYGLAYPIVHPPVGDMSISTDPETVSLRSFRRGDADYVIASGAGHEVGREPHPEQGLERLEAWVRQRLGLDRAAYRWSAQDYESYNLVPFMGRLPRGLGRIWMATGFAKWGLTNGVAAALRITGEILGDERAGWVRTIGSRITLPADQLRGVRGNTAVGAELVKGWAAAVAAAPAPEPPEEGEGRVARYGVRPVGVSVIDGRRCAVSAICPHLGGVLSWNPAERSWDCPLHGSRFAADGGRIEGPARRDLERYR